MNNFSDMLSKAKKMQEKMKEVQESLKKIEVEGVSGGNLVKITLTGDYEMKSIFIDPNAKKEKDEIVHDLIVAAYNDAKDKLKKKTSEELSKAAGVGDLPLDLKLPF
ncbi:MAG: 30S ribosomal protein S21 [Euryarchaeota archaeon]|jgi:DNA-binding protein, YbaB/EbfC family|nr:30S ribosomal protein S21 [Euryarchaeota archaeon]|tara:strand:+ start:386 stop:706 length:321 start_codon:yes stop_codon:yes gene_type:complete